MEKIREGTYTVKVSPQSNKWSDLIKNIVNNGSYVSTDVLEFKDFCKLLGVSEYNAQAIDIYCTLRDSNYLIIKRK